MDLAPIIGVQVKTACIATTASLHSVLGLFPLVSPVKNQLSQLEEAVLVSKITKQKQTAVLCSVHNLVIGREQMMLASLLQKEKRDKEREGGKEGGAISQQHSHIEQQAKWQCFLLMANKQFTAAVTKVCSVGPLLEQNYFQIRI